MTINALFEQACQGNSKSEQELFRLLHVRFRAIAYHIIRNEQTAEDISHDALVKVLESFKIVEIRESFVSWAYTVLRNTAYRYIQRQKIQTKALQRVMGQVELSSSPGTDPVLEEQIVRCLRLLAQNNRRFARVLNLKHQGFVVDEICDKLGINQNNLYVILHRARLTLKSCLDHGELHHE